MPSTFQFLYRSFFSFRDLSLKLHFSTAELTGNFENHQADLDFSVPVPEIPWKSTETILQWQVWCQGIFPIITKGGDIFVSYTFNTQWFTVFFHCSRCIWKQKNVKTSLFSLSRSTSPTKFHDNQWKKNKPLDVYLLQQLIKWWRFLCMVFVAHWWGFPWFRNMSTKWWWIPDKNSKFGRNNKKSGALVEIFQNILESTKNSSNSQSKTSLFISQMRPFITKPWRQQNRRHRGCKI